MILLMLFIGVPLIEIALFISVGGWIGLWPTLAIVLLTAVVGSIMVRQQGFHVLRQVSGSFNAMSDPTEPLAHGAMVLFSGALLLTPGFFTDAVGFALLIPAVRAAAFRFLKARIKVTGVQFSAHGSATGFQTNTSEQQKPANEDVIDVDYTDLDKPDGPSGWTKR